MKPKSGATAPQDLDGINRLNSTKNFSSCEVNGVSRVEITMPGPRERAQVVIVGAGLAGLAAAQRLYQSGANDVLLLDAQDRVGGRVHTIKHSDYLLELGAQWLHGADDNPLYQWLTSMKMLDDFEDASMGFKGLFCSSRDQMAHGQINPNLVDKVLAILNESKLNLFRDQPIDEIASCKSASQVFRQHLETNMVRDEELSANKELVYDLFEWFLRYETIENCCDSMDEVSVQSYTGWSDLGDGTLLNFKDGYQSLLAWFCQHFPCKQWLHLNKQVLNIELLLPRDSDRTDPRSGGGGLWFDTQGLAHNAPVLVRYKETGNTKSSLNQMQTIECHHVIVTVPLGFLKQHSSTLFTPPLSRTKQDLIESIGFGTVNKIILQFEAPFWPPTCGGIKLVWGKADFSDASDSSFPPWSRDILAFDVVRRQPNLLIGWIGGHGAKAMELESNETVGEVCLRILEKFLPKSHARPTRLVACLCSRWRSNAFACGSYSFRSIESSNLNIDKLHEPIYNHVHETKAATSSAGAPQGHHLMAKVSSELESNNNNNNNMNQLGSSSASRVPRVMFAGEATAGNLYSTTHGAVISGWREADRLIDHLPNNNCIGRRAPVFAEFTSSDSRVRV